MRQLALALMPCILLVGCNIGVAPRDSDIAGCRLAPPDSIAGAGQGTVRSDGPDLVGYAARDASATIVGYCSGLFKNAPTLFGKDGDLGAVGGILEPGSNQANFMIYPPTQSQVITVLDSPAPIAELVFGPVATRPCTTSSTARLTWLACGAIDLVRWDSGLHFNSSEVTLVQGSIMDGSQPLGFYVEGFSDGPTGLTINLGFQRPSGHSISIFIQSIATSAGVVPENLNTSYPVQ